MYQVGYRSGLLFDRARRDWDDAGPRPVFWSAWYPVDGGVPAALPGQFFASGLVCGDAPLAEGGPFPVILLSHGTGGAPEGLGWLAHALAGAGCIVIGPHHHGNTGREPYRAEGFLCWWERAPDLSFALRALAQDGPFAGQMDLGRVDAIGFSLGGMPCLVWLARREGLSAISIGPVLPVCRCADRRNSRN